MAKSKAELKFNATLAPGADKRNKQKKQMSDKQIMEQVYKMRKQQPRLNQKLSPAEKVANQRSQDKLKEIAQKGMNSYQRLRNMNTQNAERQDRQSQSSMGNGKKKNK